MTPKNHGKIWSGAFYAEMLLYFWDDVGISEISRRIGRKEDAVITKLINFRLGEYDLDGDFATASRDTPYVTSLIAKYLRQMVYHKTTFDECDERILTRLSRWLTLHSPGHLALPEIEYLTKLCGKEVSNAAPQPEGEEEMPKFFENNYLLNGKELAKMSNAEIYAAIAAEEEAINKLRQIFTKPKRLQDEIYDRAERLKEFVAFLDNYDEQVAKEESAEPKKG